jgi:hypothetical protein
VHAELKVSQHFENSVHKEQVRELYMQVSRKVSSITCNIPRIH